MSKKKSTMTLKDFHGGTIPSDLALPSAPGGVTLRSGSGSGSMDRTGYDRVGRNDYYRSRPRSSPTMRNFDDYMPFLTHVTHIGRNFDEDERKPLDGGGGGLGYNTRIGSDERLVRYSPTMRVVDEGKSGSMFSSSRHESSAPVMEYPRAFTRSYTVGGHSESLGMGSSGGVHSYSNPKVLSSNGVGVHSESLGTGGVHVVSRAYPNAWAPARKEVASVNDQPVWSESVAVEKLAHASALDKVSSGRWQTPRLVSAHADIEVIHYPEPDSGTHLKTWNGLVNNEMMEHCSATLPEQLERGLNIEDGFHGAEKQLQDCERPRSPAYLGTKEKNFVGYSNSGQESRKDGVSVGQEVQPPVHVDASERPMLKLLPRSKPVESSLPSAQQVHHPQTDCGHAENVTEAYGSEISEKLGSDDTDCANKVTERPKLKLKPRSLPLQELNVQVERKSHTLFGGARPRELVLKERGIDDVVEKHDPIPIPSPNRVKLDTLKAATVSAHSLNRLNDKTENPPFDINRVAKGIDRKDYCVEAGKGNMQRRNWHNENWKNTRSDNQQKPLQERQHQQLQQQERHRSPETWRKCADLPNLDAPQVRPGKTASAIELALAFSRSVSDPKRTQIPFSRLTAPTPRHQINGY